MPPYIDWLITELSTIGGAENFVRQLAPRLIERGINLRIITLASGGVWVAEMRNNGIQVIELGMTRMNFIIPTLRLAKLWIKGKPALVHTHLYHAGILGRLLAFLLGIPVVVHQHGLELKRSFSRSLADRLLAFTVKKYITSCQAVSSILQTREKIHPDKIHVVYNGIDPSIFSLIMGKSIETIRNKFGEDDIVLCSIGRLSPEKGQLYLLRAMDLLYRKKIPLQLVLIGTGSDQKMLESESLKLEISDRVHFLNLESNVYDWLASSSIFILPSLWEGLSFALLEAMGAGLPIIATNVGGTPEVVSHEVNGLLVSPKNPEALAQAIMKLILNPVLAETMAKQAQITVFEKFTIEQTILNLSWLYENMRKGSLANSI
jgi:glycosyltransferase involved in cell wall biosynthesis